MRDIQEQVRLFCLHHGMIAPVESRLLDVQSELGEVAKEVLKTTSYGKEPFHVTDEFRQELGDLAFAMLQLASTVNVDLEEEVQRAIKKYMKRLKQKGDPGSGV